MPFQPIAQEGRATDAIVNALCEGGVRYVFGLPGGYTGPIFAALHNHPTIRVIPVREESVGSMAAEAYGRLTGEPAVLMGQGAWILGNAGQGLLEALLGSAPMVILTELSEGGDFAHHGPYQGGSGDYGVWDVERGLRSIVKQVMVSRSPAQAVQHTQLALKHAVTGEPGPVAVAFHSSAVTGRVGPDSLPRVYPTSGYVFPRSGAVDFEALYAVARILSAAVQPVIIAGNGVRVGQACGSLERLATTLDAPVATTAAGKGVIPERHPLALGVIGQFGHPGAVAGVAEGDVILAVGTKLGSMDTCEGSPLLLDPSRQTSIQVDVEPLNVGWTMPIDLPLIGDAAVIMDSLSERCGPAASRNGPARVAKMIDRYAAVDDARFLSDEVPFTPQRVVSLLERAAPADTIVTCDAGENRLFMQQWFHCTNPGGYLQPAGIGTMGYAIPAAIGAKIARPDQPVLGVCGDGGFAMSIHALMTAVQEKIPIRIVVLNNRALGWYLHLMGRRATATALGNFDHSAIARSVGCGAANPHDIPSLRRAFADMFDSDGPFLVDVPTSLDVTYKEFDALARIREYHKRSPAPTAS